MVWRESAILYKVIEEASVWRQDEGRQLVTWISKAEAFQAGKHTHTHTHRSVHGTISGDGLH